jgi:cytochrome c oxidase assembly factor CtaG/putative copper export protein
MPGPVAPRPRAGAGGRSYTAAPAGHDRAWAIGGAGLAAMTSCFVALVLAGVVPGRAAVGLQDAGALTHWGLPAVGLLTNLAAVGTVGSVLVGAVLLRGRPDGRLSEVARGAVTDAGHWAAAWAMLVAVQLLLTVSEIAAVPLTGIDGTAFGSVLGSTQGRALCVTASLALVVVIVSGRVRTVTGARELVLVAAAGLVPLAAAGHASSAADHDVATSALVVHVLAATVWTGGLAGLVLHLRHRPMALAAAVPRFSTLALAAYVALAGSGLLAALTRLDASVATWSSSYGVMVLLKMAALVGLGVVGHVHRRRTVPRLLDAGAARPFLRLAAVELVVMGTAMGLAAALSRTPAPAAVVRSNHATGHPSLPGVVDPFSVVELATAWRPNAVVVVVLALALATYVNGVRTVRRRGGDWPRVRTFAFASGVLVALVDLCSGVATYAPAMVSVQVAQLLVAMLVVPALLLLGAPATLVPRVREDAWPRVGRRQGASRAERAVGHPLAGAAVSCALVLAVYRTPLIELSQRSFWLHMLVLAVAVVSGVLLLWPVMGADGADGPARLGEWDWGIVGLASCLALLAVQLRYGDRLMAGEWFLELRWSWVDPVADQRVAGAVVALAAACVLLMALLPATGLMRRARS